MKRIFFMLIVMLTLFDLSLAYARGKGGGSVSVNGYFKKDGTYVQPHTRSAPDGNPYNNYSYPGNYNPNTGEISKGDPNTYLKNYYKDKSPGLISPSYYGGSQYQPNNESGAMKKEGESKIDRFKLLNSGFKPVIGNRGALDALFK